MTNNHINQIINDFRGLIKVCGVTVAIKWLFMVVIHFNECIKSKNLQPADRALGIGPYRVRRGNAIATLKCNNVISAIREIWVRDVYLKNDYIKIPENGLVVDLGANVGNFSVLALSHNNCIRLIAVEPNKELNKIFWEQMDLNGWRNRVVLNRYFIGTMSATQKMMLKDIQSMNAEFIPAEEFIKLNNIQRIDFLKCDIEGSEFGLIENNAPLLRITEQLAIEIHDSAGDSKHFLARLKELGFTIGPVKEDPGGCIALAKRS